MKIEEGNTKEGITIPHNGHLLRVPESYEELLELSPAIKKRVHVAYLNWGQERYETGSKEYQRLSIWGRTNACYLPTTDTITDVEEELLDAMFNVMVLYWKSGGGESARLDSLNNSIIEALHWCRELRGESEL